MNERVHTSIKVILKMLCTSPPRQKEASPRRFCHWADIVSRPLFANVLRTI